MTASEQTIFLAALERSGRERSAWLEEACGGDTAMLKRLEALLQATQDADFMAAPAFRALRTGVVGEQAGDLIGPYQLEEEIGRGGFGTVWRASQKEPIRRAVALKILKPGMDTQEVVARFGQEQQALARMDHPNIARIYDAGTTPAGRPYIAMELVSGEMITGFCQRRGLDARARLELVLQVCQAVRHAHQKGMIHRDLKPSNILISEHDNKPLVKVIDFGVAKAMETLNGDHTLFTQLGQMIGTPLYMSPEQAAGQEADARSDVYSLGVLLYELLTGDTPVPAAALTECGHDEVRRRIREVDPIRPSQKVRAATRLHPHPPAGAVPGHRAPRPGGDLDWIVMKCLEKDRARRYPEVGGLTEDVERYLRSEPISARPPGRLYVMGKWIRRHRVGVSAGSAVLLVMVAGIGVSMFMAYRSDRAERSEAAVRSEADLIRQEALNHRRAALLHSYEADMGTAATLHARGETGQVAELIERYQPGPEMPDFRGFEWYYLKDQVKGDQTAILEGHDTMISSVAFSPDGSKLASGDIGGHIKVWEAASGKLLASLLQGPSRVVGVSFSHDGQWLAAGDAAQLYWWSVPGFDLKKRLPFPSVRPVFSPTASQLALGVEDNRWYGASGETRLWDWEQDPGGDAMRTFSGSGTRIAFSADGKTLVTAAGTNRLRVWSTTTAQRLAEYELSSALDIAVGRNGTWVAAAPRTPQKAPSLWPVPQESTPLPGFSGDAAGVISLAASPVDQVLAAGSSNQRITLWNTLTGQALETFRGHRNEVTALAFSRDGKWLASGSMDETVRLWKPGQSQALTEIGGVRATLGMGFPRLSADGKFIAVSTANRVMKIFHTDTLQEGMVFGYGRWPLAFSPDGRHLLSILPRGLLELWDTRTGENKGGVWLPLAPNLQCISTVSPDGLTLGLVEDRRLHFVDCRTGRSFFSSGDHRGLILGSAFSPDGRLHATVSQDGLAMVREVPSGRRILTLSGHKQDLRGIAFSPDQQWIATGGHDNLIKIWNQESGELQADITGHKQVVNFLAFSPDGKTLFSAGDDPEMLLWRTGDWKSLGRYPIPAPARSLTLSMDGSVLAVTGYPEQLRLLRAPAAAAPPHPTAPSWQLTALPAASWGRPAAMPPRQPETPPVCLDLTPFYNIRLDESWTGLMTESVTSLSALPAGFQQLGGIPWDVRGVMQVYARNLGFTDPIMGCPEFVRNIPVAQKVRRLHFLGAATWATWVGQQDKNPEIGRLTFHLENGLTESRPVMLGKDVADWFKEPGTGNQAALPLREAWSGTNETSRASGRSLGLYVFTWENPHPEHRVLSIDFTATAGCPFLVAITAEP